MKLNVFSNKMFLAGTLLFAVSLIASAAPTPVPIKIVAFGGKVTIADSADKAIAAAKDVAIPVGATISTGPNSWVDLAQGGVSTMRVKAKTQSFTVTSSSMDKDSQKVSSLFKLKNGSVYVRVNKKALPHGSKYQVQMPELIAGVVGSEGEVGSGPIGDTICNFIGGWTGTGAGGNSQNIQSGQSMANASGGNGPAISTTPPAVTAALTATATTMATPSGSATTGGCTGGTAAGAVPSATAIAPAAVPGTTTAAPAPAPTAPPPPASTPPPATSPAQTTPRTASPSSP